MRSVMLIAMVSLYASLSPHSLVSVHALDPTICIDLRYATPQNFTHQTLYPSTAKAYLCQPVARALCAVQKELKRYGFCLCVWDAYRPHGIQAFLWSICPDERYVSPPGKGGRHTRGTAVDVTLLDANGNELEMPTGFDDFTERAAANFQQCSEVALKNRALLQSVMRKYGFEPLATEWWHFDFEGWSAYPVLDSSFEDLMEVAA